MLLELMANIGRALANSSLTVQPEPTAASMEVVVSLQLSKTLEMIGVNLSEWLPEPVVRIKDIRTKKVIEFPKIQDTEEVRIELQLTSNDGVVRNKDYRETDPNNVVVVNKLIEEQQQVVVRIEDTPTRGAQFA